MSLLLGLELLVDQLDIVLVQGLFLTRDLLVLLLED